VQGEALPPDGGEPHNKQRQPDAGLCEERRTSDGACLAQEGRGQSGQTTDQHGGCRQPAHWAVPSGVTAGGQGQRDQDGGQPRNGHMGAKDYGQSPFEQMQLVGQLDLTRGRKDRRRAQDHYENQGGYLRYRLGSLDPLRPGDGGRFS
jgi:hypothetical protein